MADQERQRITGPWQIAYTELVDQTPPEATRDFTTTDRMLLGAGWLADAGGNAFESWYYLLAVTSTSFQRRCRRRRPASPRPAASGRWP